MEAEATHRCAAYQKAHYPNDRVHLGGASPNVVCIIERGPSSDCPEVKGYPVPEQVWVTVAEDGTGHVVRTLRPCTSHGT